MLGEPISMLVPQVVGFRLTGELPEGATATDLVLTVTQLLRQTGVVGKFVEYFGDGLAASPSPTARRSGTCRPEYGATCGFFPVDERDARVPAPDRAARRADRARRGLLQGEPALARPGRGADVLAGRRARPRRPSSRRSPARAARRTACRSRDAKDLVPRRARHLRRRRTRPHDRRSPTPSRRATRRPSRLAGEEPPSPAARAGRGRRAQRHRVRVRAGRREFELDHGSVVIAAITSCTNTSNPQVMIGAGLLAKKAVERGLSASRG